MTRAYKHTPAGGGGPIGAGAIPTSMQPRQGLVRVPTKAQRRRVEREYEPEPEIEDEVPADEPINGLEDMAVERENERFAYDTIPQCSFCGRGEDVDLLVKAPGPEPAHRVCATCVETLIGSVKAELPRRRLRLAMERLAAGTVSIEMVEQIEKLAAGQYPVKSDE